MRAQPSIVETWPMEGAISITEKCSDVLLGFLGEKRAFRIQLWISSFYLFKESSWTPRHTEQPTYTGWE